MRPLTWSQKFRLGALFAVILVLGLAWYSGPGFLVGAWISGWHFQQELSPRMWLAVGGGLLANFAWARFTSPWLHRRLDQPMDRAVDWAMR